MQNHNTSRHMFPLKHNPFFFSCQPFFLRVLVKDSINSRKHCKHKIPLIKRRYLPRSLREKKKQQNQMFSHSKCLQQYMQFKHCLNIQTDQSKNPHEVYKGKRDKLPLCVRNIFPRSHMNRQPTPQALVFTKQR